MRILIAEDDPDLRKILYLYLKKEEYDVYTAANGEEAVAWLAENSADLLLLDWMMPVKDGIQVCREIKALHISIKILMLTAKSESEHEFQGLTHGADDYLRKPFDMKVLLLRIKKLCRQEQLLKCGALTLNQETLEVQKADEKLTLTRTEFELLHCLMLNPGIIMTREQLLNRVWGQDYDGDMRTVDTHIRRLRAKIGEGFIRTSVGLGYTLEARHE